MKMAELQPLRGYPLLLSKYFCSFLVTHPTSGWMVVAIISIVANIGIVSGVIIRCRRQKKRCCRLSKVYRDSENTNLDTTAI